MARMTPAQIDAADAYTNAQMLKLVRHAIATLTSEPDSSVTVAGRSYILQDLDKLGRMEDRYAAKAAEDADADAVESIGCPVVRYQGEQT